MKSVFIIILHFYSQAVHLRVPVAFHKLKVNATVDFLLPLMPEPSLHLLHGYGYKPLLKFFCLLTDSFFGETEQICH
jgi:hypothetical protein